MTEAAWEGRTEVVSQLLKAGANIDLQNYVSLIVVRCVGVSKAPPKNKELFFEFSRQISTS